MKKILILLYLSFCFVVQNHSFSQIAYNSYFVAFKDKNNNAYSIDKPEDFLSKQSLLRREKQNITINYIDLPVSNAYIDSLIHLNVKILNKSKWLNGVTIYTEDTSILNIIQNFSFVDTVIISKKNSDIKDPKLYNVYDYSRIPERISNFKKVNKRKNYYNYGISFPQININNGQFLHNQRFCGDNMVIAITDDGYQGAEKYDSFKHLFAKNKILDTYNFVSSNDSVFNVGGHGTSCLSILCSDISGKFIGSAPNADYVLLITENGDKEEYIEEYNWVSAAEFADSIGADVISASLSYYKFDTNTFDHNYYDLNGKTAVISCAATIAASKGMIVCVAASNSYSWIHVPSDADSILTVAAVNPDGKHSAFSSVGYSADGRIKPDVAAMGTNVIHQGRNNSISGGAGTSFATPIIAGLAACLWQKYPQKSNMEIIDAIRKSSNNYFNPTNTCGYGIPDFEIASLLLENTNNDSVISLDNILNKDIVSFDVSYNENDKVQIKIVNKKNKVVYKEKIDSKIKNGDNQDSNYKKRINISVNLDKSGIYEIKVKINNNDFSKKLIKY